MKPTSNYWFPTKRYGWGWGIPHTWQGRFVFGLYFVSLILAAIFISPMTRPLAFTIAVAAINVVFVAICWLKGEPPRWSWGGD